jgi:anti-anti-sigma factor
VRAEDFKISMESDGRPVRVFVAGELDIATAPGLLAHISAGHGSDGGFVILDLSGVTFIDSSGLLARMDAEQELEGRLSIIPSEPCLRLFNLVGATDRLPPLESP